MRCMRTRQLSASALARLNGTLPSSANWSTPCAGLASAPIDAGMHILGGRIDRLAANPQISAPTFADGDFTAGMNPAADPIGERRRRCRHYRRHGRRWQPAHRPALRTIGRGLIRHAAIGAAGFADQNEIARNEITRCQASLAVCRAARIVRRILDEMDLRPVGNDLGDRNRVLHVEADAETVAGAFLGRGETRHRQYDESGGDRARLRQAARAVRSHGADRDSSAAASGCVCRSRQRSHCIKRASAAAPVVRRRRPKSRRSAR